jgi:hypothetical protein
MRIPSFRREVCAVLAAALLASCANGASSGALVPATGGVTLSNSPAARATHTVLFVVMNGQAGIGFYGVDIFSWPALKLVGTLSGFNDALGGACSDAKGNVYVIVSGYTASQPPVIEEYSQQGKLLNTYTDSDGIPSSCAVNPTNGDLAVANFLGDGSCGYSCYYPGNLVIYSSSSSTPKVLTNSTEQNYQYPAYDPNGHLWETGVDIYRTAQLYSCRKAHCKAIAFSGGTIHFPAGLQWAKTFKTWIIFDSACNRPNHNNGACSYLVSNQGALTSKTTYSTYKGGATCNIGEAVLTPNEEQVVSGDAEVGCGYTSSTVDVWGYPAGGDPIKDYIFQGSMYATPTGIAFSTKE